MSLPTKESDVWIVCHWISVTVCWVCVIRCIVNWVGDNLSRNGGDQSEDGNNQ